MEMQDEYGRAVDEAGCPLAPLTREQAFIGYADSPLGIKDALRMRVDPEAVGGRIKRYAYDYYYEAKERYVPAKGVNTYYWRLPLFIAGDLEQVKGLVGRLDEQELRLNKYAEPYYSETRLYYGMITEAMGMLDTKYSGTHQWRGHKRMSYEKHRELAHGAAHWLLHDPRTEDDGLENNTLTLAGCIEAINHDPNAIEYIDPAAVALALRDKYRHLLDKVCDYCGKTFGEVGE